MVPSFVSSHRKEVYNPKTFILHAALLGQGFPHCPIFLTAASRRSLDRISVPVWPVILSDRLIIVALVGRYPHQLANDAQAPLLPIKSFTPSRCRVVVICGISTSFPMLFPSKRQVAHVLLTRPPLTSQRASSPSRPFDLHVLSTPPAFVLSQDQTLTFMVFKIGESQ